MKLIDYIISAQNKSGSIKPAPNALKDLKSSIEGVPFALNQPSMSGLFNMNNIMQGLKILQKQMGGLENIGAFQQILQQINNGTVTQKQLEDALGAGGSLATVLMNYQSLESIEQSTTIATGGRVSNSNSDEAGTSPLYYTKSQIDAGFYDKEYIETNFYNKTDIDNDVYTKTYIDTNFYYKTEITTNYYNKTSIDTNFYDKTDVDSLLENVVHYAANASIIPTSNGTLNLGSANNRWNVAFVADLDLSNEHGDWTIVEGSDDLFLYNNKNSKVYKFIIEQVEPTDAPPKRK